MLEVLCATRSRSGWREQSLLHSDQWRDCKPSGHTLNFMRGKPLMDRRASPVFRVLALARCAALGFLHAVIKALRFRKRSKTNPPAFAGGACGRSIKTFHAALRTAGTRRASLELHNREVQLRGCNHARADKTAEAIPRDLAGICGWSWFAGRSRVDAVLRLARPPGHLLRARTNPKGVAMASRQPSFQEEMLGALSFVRSLVGSGLNGR
jgi:hypothetical protein